MAFPMNRPQTPGERPAPPSELDVTLPATQRQYYEPPARWALIDGKWVYGAHQGVVLANGSLRDYYNTNSDPQNIWYSLSNQRRSNIIDIFESKGIPARTFGQQLEGIRQLLFQSNALGVGWETALSRLDKLPDMKGPSGPSYRLANPADLRAVAKAVFRETLGRTATEEEAAQFVQSYQQAQRRGTGTVAAPSADVAARDFAQIAAPKEASAYGILNYIGEFVNAVQGMGR